MLNENLAKARKARGLTQEALAVKLNVVRQTISKWEKGTAVPDVETLHRIAEALEVSVSSLLGEPEQTDKADSALIAKTLAQINEHLAVRNRRTAKIWKIAGIALLVSVVLLAGILFLNYSPKNSAAPAALPENISVSGLRFVGHTDELACFFVPSFGGTDIRYAVTLSIPGTDSEITAEAAYINGTCSAVFDKTILLENVPYTAVLQMESGDAVRSFSLAEVTLTPENSCEWTSQ